MIRDLGLLDRAEGAQPDVQHDRRDGDTLIPQFLQQLPGEMQSGGRCGGGAFGAGIDGLVAVVILQLLGDIGRQGHQPDLVQNVVDILVFFVVEGEPDEAVPFLQDVRHLAREDAVSEDTARAYPRPLTRLDQALPRIQLVLAQEQKLQPCLLPALGVPIQARGNDLGVVDDQNVLRGNIVRDIIEMPVFDRTVRPVDDHEPGGVAAVGGMMGYQLRGQVVGEIRGLQICSDALVENNVRLYCIHICGTSLTVR